jgi:hypothetical protein
LVHNFANDFGGIDGGGIFGVFWLLAKGAAIFATKYR